MQFNDSSSLNTRNQCALPTHPEAISRNVKKLILAKNHITSFTKVVLFRNLALNCEQRNWFEQNLKPRHIYIFKHVYFDRVSLVFTHHSCRPHRIPLNIIKTNITHRQSTLLFTGISSPA